MIAFNSLFEYLFLLRGVAESLAPHGPNVMLYLAAAVSDFYIPSQSRVCIFYYHLFAQNEVQVKINF